MADKPKTERHLVSGRIWVELPASLNKKEVKARIGRLTKNLQKTHVGYNPKAQQHGK